MFRRKQRREDGEATGTDRDDFGDAGLDAFADGEEEQGHTADVDPYADTAPTRPPGERQTSGPWDLADAPADDSRIDLGALQLPLPDGMELRVEVSPEGNTVVAVVLVDGASALQIGAFAAPKSGGIWPEVADEIVTSLRGAGGGAEPVDGTFGRELTARIPMEGSGGQRAVQPARFVGVDGPRWFLRGLFQGPAATDPVQARRLEEAFRSVVVVRGGEAMAPRDPLPVRVPKDAVDAASAQAEAGQTQPEAPTHGDGYNLDPFERGPEITETR